MFSKEKLLIAVLENTIDACKKQLCSAELFLNYIKSHTVQTSNDINVLPPSLRENNLDETDSLEEFNIHPFNIDLQEYRQNRLDGYESDNLNDLEILGHLNQLEKPKEQLEKPKEPEKLFIPTIDPLLTITPSEKTILIKQIFNDAKYNIENLIQNPIDNSIGIETNSDAYETALFAEADRLLNIWKELKKVKKSFKN